MVNTTELKAKLDWKSVKMLEVLRDNGGQANTTDFKHATDWNSSVIHYRYDKLADLDLITTRKGHTDTDRIPPTVATLTDTGEQAIQDGLIEAFDLDDLNVRGLAEMVEHLEHQTESLEKQLGDRTTHYDKRLADIETRLDDIEEVLEQIANRSVIDRVLGS